MSPGGAARLCGKRPAAEGGREFMAKGKCAAMASPRNQLSAGVEGLARRHAWEADCADTAQGQRNPIAVRTMAYDLLDLLFGQGWTWNVLRLAGLIVIAVCFMRFSCCLLTKKTASASAEQQRPHSLPPQDATEYACPANADLLRPDGNGPWAAHQSSRRQRARR